MSLPFAQKPQPTPGQLPRLSARVLLASSMNLQLVCGEERKAVWFVKQFQWGLNCFCQTACIIKAKWILCALNFPCCGFLKHAVLSSDLHHSLGGDWVVSGRWACMFPKGGKRSVGANRQGKTSRKETRLMLKNRHVSVQTQRERETVRKVCQTV